MWTRFACWHAQSAELGEFSLLKCINHDLPCSLHACCMILWDGKCLASTKLSPDARISESRFLADSERERRNGKKQISIKRFKGLQLGVVTFSFNFIWLFMYILKLHGRFSGVVHSYWGMCFIILEASKEWGRLYPYSKSFGRAQQWQGSEKQCGCSYRKLQVTCGPCENGSVSSEHWGHRYSWNSGAVGCEDRVHFCPP